MVHDESGGKPSALQKTVLECGSLLARPRAKLACHVASQGEGTSKGWSSKLLLHVSFNWVKLWVRLTTQHPKSASERRLPVRPSEE